MASGKRRSGSVAHLCGGIVAGFASTTLLYPLEVVRVRFQANFSYNNTFHAVWKLAGSRDLYRGFTLGIVGSSLAWGQFFWTYNGLKQILQHGREERLSPIHHLACSTFSGVIVQLTLCPLWVVKNNQQLGNFNSMLSGVQQLYASEGIRGFYRGVAPGLFSSIQGGVQFLMYEELRRRALKAHLGDPILTSQVSLKHKHDRADRGIGYLPVPVTIACTILAKTVLYCIVCIFKYANTLGYANNISY
ncbi:hypothetical protein AAMO2058_001387700 [Amorphochlora amoebiformis]